MPALSKIRSLSSFIISGGIHVGLAVAMMTIPQITKEKYETVDLAVHQQKPPKPEPEPEPEPEAEPPEPEPEPEPKKPQLKKAPKEEVVEEEPPPPPPEEKAPEEAPEAPPVFDLGDNSFAAGGQGGSWSLKRSEGNTKFAAVAGKKQKSVRNTKPVKIAQGKPGGTGKKEQYRPIPLKDLSERPKPKNGSVPTPPYPVEARRADIEGAVVMQVFLDKKGKVRRMRIIKTPSELLADAAKQTMSSVLWTPALDKIGNPVDTVFVYTFRFVLDG